jgi:hypothetical protein
MLTDYEKKIIKEHEDEQKKREELRIQRWKRFSPSEKHMTLMYMYRLETDIEHINNYLETHRFLAMNVCFDDLPTYLCRLPTTELYREAYEVLGLEAPTTKKPKRQSEASL